VMSGAGSALMGIGSARGDDRAIVAAESAIASPLLEASVEGAHGVLMNISGGSDLGLFEIHEAAQLVADAAHPDANIIFGAVIDDALGDEVRVTVIAAGFDGGTMRPRTAELPRRQPTRTPGPAEREEPERAADSGSTTDPESRESTEPRTPLRPQPPRRTIVFEDSDDLDVPDFLK
jgi:cell division protein FtsZ